MVKQQGSEPIKTHIIGIDALRFFAALLVALLHLVGTYPAAVERPGTMAYHFAGAFGMPAAIDVVPTWLKTLSFSGFVGVPLFFSLSGFVIAYSVARPGFISFLWARFLRLWPALLICTSIAAVILLASDYQSLQVVSASFARTMIFFPAGPYVDDVFWTIVLEVVFYLLMGGVVAVFGTSGILYFAVYLTAISLCYNSLVTLLQCGDYGGTNAVCSLVGHNAVRKLGRIALFEHGAFFASGVSLWWLWARDNRSILAISALAVSVIPAIMQIDQSVVYEYVRFSEYGAQRSSILASFLWVFGVVLIAISSFQWQIVDRVMGPVKPALRLIGLATYPFYLLHITIGTLTISALSNHVSYLWASAIAICLVLAVSMFIAAFVEPALRRGLLTFCR